MWKPLSKFSKERERELVGALVEKPTFPTVNSLSLTEVHIKYTVRIHQIHSAGQEMKKNNHDFYDYKPIFYKKIMVESLVGIFSISKQVEQTFQHPQIG